MTTDRSLTLSGDQVQLLRESVQYCRASVMQEIDYWRRKMRAAAYSCYPMDDMEALLAPCEQQAKELAELMEMLRAGESA